MNILNRSRSEVATELAALRAQVQMLESTLLQRLERVAGNSSEQARAGAADYGWSHAATYDPGLVPPPILMAHEQITNLEEWFRWGEEWRWILRYFGRMTLRSSVLEIGCGLGRTAFAFRHFLTEGTYDGFEIVRHKVGFLHQAFQPAYPNFRFTWADVRNTCYNPDGAIDAATFRFPYEDQAFDIVYAASVFTHMLPQTAEHYFRESARVLKSGGRCVFSFFLLDHYRPGSPRPSTFNLSWFDFDHSYESFGTDFAIALPTNPESMTAYKTEFIEAMANRTGLRVVQPTVAGYWSGSVESWTTTQDLVVLEKV